MFIRDDDDLSGDYLRVRRRLQEVANTFHFDVKFLAHGGMVAAGRYYKLLRHLETPQVRLVAAHDPYHLTGRRDKGADFRYPAFPDKVHIVRQYPEMPAFTRKIFGDIIDDYNAWFEFMVGNGNLVELSSNQDEPLRFKNDFAFYTAEPVKKNGNSHTYKISVSFKTGEGNGGRSSSFIGRQLNFITSGLFDFKSHGIHLGDAESRDAARRFVHRDFCRRFDLFLNCKSPLLPQDIRRDFKRALTMLVRNKVDEMSIDEVIEADRMLEWLKFSMTLGLHEGCVDVLQACVKFRRRLKHAKGDFFQAILAESHPDYRQERMRPDEASSWPIMTADEVRLYPYGEKFHASIAQAWIDEDLLTVINSLNPCLIKDIGNEVLAVQSPSGEKLYYGTKNEVYVPYATRQRLDPVQECDPDVFTIPETLREFFQEGKVVRLRLQHQHVPVHSEKGVATEASLSYSIERKFLPVDEAYEQIGTMALVPPDELVTHDGPGEIPFNFRPVIPIFEIKGDQPPSPQAA